MNIERGVLDSCRVWKKIICLVIHNNNNNIPTITRHIHMWKFKTKNKKKCVPRTHTKDNENQVKQETNKETSGISVVKIDHGRNYVYYKTVKLPFFFPQKVKILWIHFILVSNVFILSPVNELCRQWSADGLMSLFKSVLYISWKLWNSMQKLECLAKKASCNKKKVHCCNASVLMR